jgi:hypothetical protein
MPCTHARTHILQRYTQALPSCDRIAHAKRQDSTHCMEESNRLECWKLHTMRKLKLVLVLYNHVLLLPRHTTIACSCSAREAIEESIQTLFGFGVVQMVLVEQECQVVHRTALGKVRHQHDDALFEFVALLGCQSTCVVHHGTMWHDTSGLKIDCVACKD